MANANQQFQGEESLSEPNIYVSLTYDPLDASAAMARVKSPKAGAVVLFAGEQTSQSSSLPGLSNLSH
jgi:molybdopterin synthase catalytic subunit